MGCCCAKHIIPEVETTIMRKEVLNDDPIMVEESIPPIESQPMPVDPPIENLENGPSFLVDILDRSLDVADVNSGKQVRVSRSLISSGTRALFIPSGFVFLCGGKNRTSTWGIKVERGRFEELCPMKVGRENHSLVHCNGVIYVTGGSSYSELSSCEKYVNKEWKTIADLNIPRSYHSSVNVLDKIYVCGGIRQNSIEVFDGNHWDILNMSLPASLTRLGIAPLTPSSFIISGGEVVGTGYNYKTWEINFEKSVVKEVESIKDVMLCSSTGCFIDHTCYMYSDGLVFKYDSSLSKWVH